MNKVERAEAKRARRRWRNLTCTPGSFSGYCRRDEVETMAGPDRGAWRQARVERQTKTSARRHVKWSALLALWGREFARSFRG